MVVIPQEMLARLEEYKTTAATPTNNSGDLNAEMRRIMSNQKLNDSDKWKQYQQVLRRFLHLATEKRQPINLPILESSDGGGGGEDIINPLITSDERSASINNVNDTLLHDEIIESLPAAYKTETRGLLRAMNKRPDLIRWNDDGTVIVRDERIPDSNIIDIIHHIVRQRKTTHFPTGWREVMSVLKDMNVPSTYLGNLSAYDFLGRSPLLSSPMYSQVHSNLATPLASSTLSSSSRSRSRHRAESSSALTPYSRVSLEDRRPARRSAIPLQWLPETPSPTPPPRGRALQKGWENF